MILFHNDENIAIKASPLICYHFPQKWLSKLIFLFILNFGRVMEPHGSLRPRISVKQQHAAFVNLFSIFQPGSIFSLLEHLWQMFLHQDFLHSLFHTSSGSQFWQWWMCQEEMFSLSSLSKDKDPPADPLETMLLENLKTSWSKIYLVLYKTVEVLSYGSSLGEYSISAKHVILIGVGLRFPKRGKANKKGYFCF